MKKHTTKNKKTIRISSLKVCSYLTRDLLVRPEGSPTTVLDGTAGTGIITDYLTHFYPGMFEIQYCEKNTGRHNICQHKGHSCYARDFFELSGWDFRKFNNLILTPPFSNLDSFYKKAMEAKKYCKIIILANFEFYRKIVDDHADDCIEYRLLPNGSFMEEGKNVDCGIITIYYGNKI